MSKAQEFIKRKFNIKELKNVIGNEVDEGEDIHLMTIGKASDRRYMGHVLCNYFELTPSQLGLTEYVGNKYNNDYKVDYVELAKENGIEDERFDPFILQFNWLDEVSEELSKQIGSKLEIIVKPENNFLGLKLVKK